MSRYIIDFASLAKLLLPPFLRQAKMLSWLRALVKPIQSLNIRFNALMSRIRYRMRFNGQVMYLKHILNDFYDPVLRRIYLGDGNVLGLPEYIYNRVELRPKYLRNRSEGIAVPYLRNRMEYDMAVDFIVWVPNALLSADPELARKIRALVNHYRLSGRRFRVQGF
jgi:hypothetical protein